MQAAYPDLSAPSAASPDSASDHSGLPFHDQISNPHSPASMQGGNAAPEPLSMHVDHDRQSQPHSAPSATSGAGVSFISPPAVAAAVKAPWDDNDNVWNTQSAPAHSLAPAAAPASPSLPPGNGALSQASTAAEKIPSLHTDPHPTQVATSQLAMDGVIASCTPEGSPKRPPTPPQKPSASTTAKVDALNRQIANRTAAMDAATKEREAKITAAAQEYLKALNAKREEEVTAAKENHKKEQQMDVKRISDYKKSGAVWDAVGMLVDLQKPNLYSKSTEHMRSVLSTLNTAPDKK
ncbi:hypothetical protein JKF63_05731 [Porcisia hertigi]|uniref:Clathrin light chain n=1 Tax=Porcisia hertigi TaxID=2761500 RepID=A0A836IL56_9TRYP|nr:hypothetical protein JKF63_05731 [Porcisia hertigi]